MATATCTFCQIPDASHACAQVDVSAKLYPNKLRNQNSVPSCALVEHSCVDDNLHGEDDSLCVSQLLK